VELPASYVRGHCPAWLLLVAGARAGAAAAHAAARGARASEAASTQCVRDSLAGCLAAEPQPSTRLVECQVGSVVSLTHHARASPNKHWSLNANMETSQKWLAGRPPTRGG
jgi:hypothetical protein